MTKDEHIRWAKQRALEYLDRGDMGNAFTSMGSDLRKHPELRDRPGIEGMIQIGLLYLMQKDAPALRRWINGFRDGTEGSLPLI